jgi:AcrR family transcriptional regulator
MQVPKALQGRRSNVERTRATREALLAAARGQFLVRGFAGTSTPDIATAAGVTRGALYHHFPDKGELFRAVLEEEARAVAAEITIAAEPSLPAHEALAAGACAYLDAMRVPGRTRLLLIEGPAVIGITAMRALDEANAERTLVEGLTTALSGRGLGADAVARLSELLSAAFDRAALAIDAGGDARAYRETMLGLLFSIVPRPCT